MRQINRNQGMLGVVIAVLFSLAILTFPFAFSVTWSQDASSADRTLTYTTDKLTWDSSAPTNEDGTVVLELFKSEYQREDGKKISSNNGDAIVAPNTSNSKTVRFLNETGEAVRYYATLYRSDNTENVNIDAEITGGENTKTHYIPEGVSDEDVICAQTAVVGASSSAELGVDWEWKYDESEEQDASDTKAGDASYEDSQYVNYHLFVVVDKDTNSSTAGGSASAQGSGLSVPSTGDKTPVQVAFALVLTTLVCVIVSAIRDRRKAKSEATSKQALQL